MKTNGLLKRVEKVQEIKEWAKKVRILTGLECIAINEILHKKCYTLEELQNAQLKDNTTLKGIANDLMRLCL